MGDEPLAGAGGDWRILDDQPDPSVVQQQNAQSWGAACAEMLFKSHCRYDFSEPSSEIVEITRAHGCHSLNSGLSTLIFSQSCR